MPKKPLEEYSRQYRHVLREREKGLCWCGDPLAVRKDGKLASRCLDCLNQWRDYMRIKRKATKVYANTMVPR